MKNIIIAIIAILIATSIFVLINSSRTSQKPTFPTSQNETIPSSTLDNNLSTYTDASGFTFQYPHEVLVNKKDLSNSLLYSSVELTATGSAETITIKAEESSINTVDDWFKGNKKTSVFGEIKKIKLADLDARQFEANNAKTTIALDQGVLFTIATNAKKNSEIAKGYETVIGSFVFVQPSHSAQNSSQNQSDTSSDVVEENVVQ